MGKIKWNTKGAVVDAVEPDDGPQFEAYDGPLPPKNSILRAAVELCYVQEFASGNGGLKLLLKVDEPKASPKARYNGCPIWEQLVDVDTQDFKIRQFMDAIGGSGRHWDNTMTAKDDKQRDAVVKFGNILVKDLAVRIVVGHELYEGEKQVRVARYLPKGEEREAQTADDSDAGDEPPF